MQQMQGLVVTISPSQSAFFAGEQFTAIITFTNPNRPLPSSTTLLNNQRRLNSNSNYFKSNLINQQQQQSNRIIPQSARVTNSDWSKQQEETITSSSSVNDRRISTSSSIIEYSSSYLDTDSPDFPPSPYHNQTTPQQNQQRESIISTSSGGALPTPHSAGFGPLPIPTQSSLLRSVSTNALAGPSNSNSNSTSNNSNSNNPNSKSTPILPTRKGLIGKPLVRTSVSNLNISQLEQGEVRKSNITTSGIYGNSIRRPTSGNSHGRTQSMAVSSPELLQQQGGMTMLRNSNPPSSAGLSGLGGKGHGKSRLGGSLGGGEALAGLLFDQSRRGSGTGCMYFLIAYRYNRLILLVVVVPLAIIEEPSSPNDSESFATTNNNSNLTLSLSSPPRKSSPYIPHYPNQSFSLTPLAPTSSSSSLSTRDQTYSSSTSLNNS